MSWANYIGKPLKFKVDYWYETGTIKELEALGGLLFLVMDNGKRINVNNIISFWEVKDEPQAD